MYNIIHLAVIHYEILVQNNTIQLLLHQKKQKN